MLVCGGGGGARRLVGKRKEIETGKGERGGTRWIHISVCGEC